MNGSNIFIETFYNAQMLFLIVLIWTLRSVSFGLDSDRSSGSCSFGGGRQICVGCVMRSALIFSSTRCVMQQSPGQCSHYPLIRCFIPQSCRGTLWGIVKTRVHRNRSGMFGSNGPRIWCLSIEKQWLQTGLTHPKLNLKQTAASIYFSTWWNQASHHTRSIFSSDNE